MMLSQYTFTINLSSYKAGGVLRDGARLLLDNIGSELRDLYVRDQLQKRLGSFEPPIITEHTRRQDFSLPHPPGCDWEEQEQEEIYIHFLRLIAYAIDENYQKVVADCVAQFNVDKKPFSHRGIKSIKGFPRMLNEMLSAADHRHAKKPRPAKNVDINRCLVPTEGWKDMLGVMEAR